jgi:formylglycine-generating enzyme
MLNRLHWYKVNSKDGSELVLVPGGWFWMGSGDEEPDARAEEKPKHLHYVDPFYFGIVCVTVAQYRNFVKDTDHAIGSDWQNDPDEHPVRSVNWHDATAYCKWAGLRLPAEAEWELAARGYRALKYPWGKEWEEGRRVCWDKQKGPKGNTAPVHDHPEGVSPFGSFQQSGNLWEWCADTSDLKGYERYTQGDFSVPFQGQYRALRGGSWLLSVPRYLRGGYRGYYDHPDSRVDLYGFRAAGSVSL